MRSRVLAAACLVCLAACSPPHASAPVALLPRAAFGADVVGRALAYEAALSEHYTTPPPPGEPYFQVLSGSSSVLVITPHATCPTRNGKQRFNDGGSGSLGFMLHQLAHVTLITPTYAQPSDPNYSDDNDIKREIARLLATGQYRLVLDLHTSHANQPYDVDLGTMHGTSVNGDASILTDLIARLRQQGVVDLSQDYFAASKQATDTKWAHAHGVPAVQVEINSTWLLSAKDGKASDQASLRTHRFTQVLEALVNFVRQRDGVKDAATSGVETEAADDR